MKKIWLCEQGFQFRFRRGGGTVPPLWGGTQGGGISPEGGRMARDADATIWLLNCEYAMALYHHFMLLQTFLKYFQRRINLKVKKNMYSKKNKCSRSGKILRKGGDPPHRGGGLIGGGLPSEGGGMTSSVRCPPPKWKPCGVKNK